MKKVPCYRRSTLKKLFFPECLEKGKVFHLDGLSLDFGDWWFNVRASNTEPLLRLNLEAPNAKMMEEKKAELVKIITGGK